MRCVGRVFGNAVGSIEVGGALRGQASNPFPAGVWSLDSAATRAAKGGSTQGDQRLQRTREGLDYIASAMRSAIQRHNARFLVEVEGFASGVSYACSNLKEDLSAVTEAARYNGSSLPEDLPPCSGERATECYEASGDRVVIRAEGRELSCAGKGDANPLLAVLRARSVARKLALKLCGKEQSDACAWSLRTKLDLPGSGTGGAENQRFRIYIHRLAE